MRKKCTTKTCTMYRKWLQIDGIPVHCTTNSYEFQWFVRTKMKSCTKYDRVQKCTEICVHCTVMCCKLGNFLYNVRQFLWSLRTVYNISVSLLYIVQLLGLLAYQLYIVRLKWYNVHVFVGKTEKSCTMYMFLDNIYSFVQKINENVRTFYCTKCCWVKSCTLS